MDFGQNPYLKGSVQNVIQSQFSSGQDALCYDSGERCAQTFSTFPANLRQTHGSQFLYNKQGNTFFLL